MKPHRNSVYGHRLGVRVYPLVTVCFEVSHLPVAHYSEHGTGNVFIGDGGFYRFVSVQQMTGIHADLFGGNTLQGLCRCLQSKQRKERKEGISFIILGYYQCSFEFIFLYKHPLPFSLNHALATVPLPFHSPIPVLLQSCGYHGLPISGYSAACSPSYYLSRGPVVS